MLSIWRYPPRREYKARAAAVTSRMMSAVKNKDSKAERLLRAELFRRGYRYRLHHRELVGKPDMVFVRFRVAVFVDSDFWHARALVANGEPALRAVIRGDRQDWWVAKLTRNACRDIEVTRRLAQDGWKVVRVWESEVLADAVRCADHVEALFPTSERRLRPEPTKAPGSNDRAGEGTGSTRGRPRTAPHPFLRESNGPVRHEAQQYDVAPKRRRRKLRS